MSAIDKINDLYLHEGHEVAGSKKESTHVMRVVGGLIYMTFVYNSKLESSGENVTNQFVPYDGFLRFDNGELKDPTKVSGTPIDNLDIGMRAIHCLHFEQIYSVEQLISFLKKGGNLRRIENLGAKTKHEILVALDDWKVSYEYR